MTRKSTNADKKLLENGYKLLIKNGASKLSIRDVCNKANVNLGMFHYYFGSKNKFIEEILNHIYDDFFSRAVPPFIRNSQPESRCIMLIA